MDTVVELRNVTRRFGGTPAAVDVSFDVPEGEVFGLLGHNGAGKTTLIRLINGLLVPHEGWIKTLGLDPLSQGHVIRRRTGVLTTYPGLDEYLSAAENLSVYAAIQGLSPSVTRTRIGQLLTRLGLDPRSTAPSRGLSAGLKQRVALARALIHDPALLLLDEPTANLDPIAARGVRDLVRGLAAEGRTVIFSTHNLAEAEALCDRVAILQNGNLLAVGSIRELAERWLQRSVDILVGPDQERAALDALAPHLNGHATSSRGNRIRISGATTDEVATFVRVLVTTGVDVHEAVPRSPTLEDVYMAVHQPVRHP